MTTTNFKSMLPVCFLVFLIVFSKGHPCTNNTSVKITNGTFFSDGTVVFDGVTYPKEFVYQANFSGYLDTYGCLCEVQKCLRKCCPIGFVMDLSVRSCVESNTQDIFLNKGIDIHFMDSFVKTVGLKESGFKFLFGKPGDEVYLEDEGHWWIQKDGKLYMEMPMNIPPWTVRGPDKYCIDTFVYHNPNGTVTTQLDALVCFEVPESDNAGMTLSSTCMLISCVFILATVAVYAWLPELRNLHGKVLMAYLLCLFVGFLFFATLQIQLICNNITPELCVVWSFIIYLSLLSAFFWLNVMSFDIWWTFSGKRGLSLEKLSVRARFRAYAAYAFGVPTLLTIAMAALEFSGLPAHPLLPNLRRQGCFLYGKSKLIYLYGPIVVLCVANMIFFILTAVKISQIRRQTSVLKSKESTTHDQTRNDQQRLLLYVKLFAVMGINWILEVVSGLYPDAYWLFKYTDAYNVLIGLIIFIIFVCKRKIFMLMKKRYMQLRGHPMSRTVTASSRTVSSRDDYRMSSIKNNAQ